MTAQRLKYSHGSLYRVLYRAVQFSIRAILRILYRAEVHGLEHVPDRGKVILCSNHISYLDPVLIGAYIPRYTYFMAKKELFKSGFLSNTVTYFNAFPVKRAGTDRQAFNTSLQVLKNQNLLGLFPEGTRSTDGIIRKGKKGLGLISFLSGADILPVAVSGTNKIVQKPHKRLFFPRIRMIVGEVIDTGSIIAENGKKEAASIMVEKTMKSIEELYSRISGDDDHDKS